MNIFKTAVIASLAVIALTGCSSDNNPLSKIEYFPVLTDGSRKWSFVGKDGNIICEEQFDNRPSCIVDGYFSVPTSDDPYNNPSYALYRLDGEKAHVVKGMDDLTSVGYFWDGMVGVVHRESRISFIDGDGKEVLTLNPIDGKEIVMADVRFCDGLLLVQFDNEKCGYLDKEGKIVIKPAYDSATPFCNGHAIAARQNDDETTYYFLDTKGEVTYKTSKSYSFSHNGAYEDFTLDHGFSEDGWAPVCERHREGEYRWGFINYEGKFEKAPSKVKAIGTFNSDVYCFSDEDDSWGVMGRDGKQIIAPKYQRIVIINDGKGFLAMKDDEYLILDSDGKKKKTDIGNYSQVWAIGAEGFHFFGLDGNRWQLLDADGKPISDEFKDIGGGLHCGGLLVSDYFDGKDIVENIVKSVNDKRIAKFKLGSRAQIYLDNPSDFCYTANFSADSLTRDYGKYALSFPEIVCDQRIAEYNHDYYYDTSEYHFNPNSHICGGTMDVSTTIPRFWNRISRKLAEAYTKEGFTVNSETSEAIELCKGDVTITITPHWEGIRIKVYLETEPPVEEAAPAEAEGLPAEEGE